jgi:hypothetical protein
VSTVKDLLKYARFHMGDDNKIIKRKTLETMRKKQINAGERGDMGITWFIRYADDLTAYAHGGATHANKLFLLHS